MICCKYFYLVQIKQKQKILICLYLALPGHDGGAYAITYEPNSQLLFSGGKRGEIGKDKRQKTVNKR